MRLLMSTHLQLFFAAAHIYLCIKRGRSHRPHNVMNSYAPQTPWLWVAQNKPRLISRTSPSAVVCWFFQSCVLAVLRVSEAPHLMQSSNKADNRRSPFQCCNLAGTPPFGRNNSTCLVHGNSLLCNSSLSLCRFGNIRIYSQSENTGT